MIKIKFGVGGSKPSKLLSQKKAFIVIGLPAAGKSGIANKIADITGSYIIDNDYAKRKIPEYYDSPIGASVTHEESDAIIFGNKTQKDFNLFTPLITLNTQFTVGLYLDNYASLITDDHSDKGIIIIQDTLFSMENSISKDLLQHSNIGGVDLEIQTAIRKSFNNHEFVQANFLYEAETLTIICSPMPFACNEDLLGVFFIISKELERVPEDLPVTLKIFNRMISNWIYRYNECINSRISNQQ